MNNKNYNHTLSPQRELRWLQLGALLVAISIPLTFIYIKPALVGVIPLVILLLALAVVYGAYLPHLRERFIRESSFPSHLKSKLRFSYPQLTAKDVDLVEHGLRQFFIANLKSRGHFVAMPSQVVDAMWHDFILHTRAYEDWCKQAFGKVLHHTPAEALSNDIAKAKRNDGLRRTWYWACKEESIDPCNPTRLPLLFALDKKLDIPNGFYYVPDCRDIEKKSAAGAGCGGDGGTVYCGTSFSDGGGASDGGSSSDGGYPGDAGGFGGTDGGGGDGGGSGCGGGD